MSMSHEDRQWLEGRLNAVKQELREDNRAMETSRAYVAGIGAALAYVATWLPEKERGV